MGDLLYNVQNGGGCAGGHHTAFTCDWTGGVAQNSCCGRGGGSWGSWDTDAHDTYEEVRDDLYECLQSMWDEGITPGQKGHWQTMRSTSYTTAHCGFAFTTSGRTMMNQDFSRGLAEPLCTCDGEGTEAGADDGCGGTHYNYMDF